VAKNTVGDPTKILVKHTAKHGVDFIIKAYLNPNLMKENFNLVHF
jgi:hypothetical protein